MKQKIWYMHGKWWFLGACYGYDSWAHCVRDLCIGFKART
jgi:hypothetical protein